LVTFSTKYAEASSTHISNFFRTLRVLDFMFIAFCKAWAAMIHPSHGGSGRGIKLKELAHRAHQPESAVSGVQFLWTRLSNKGTDQRARRTVE